MDHKITEDNYISEIIVKLEDYYSHLCIAGTQKERDKVTAILKYLNKTN